jgi:hypothetical protein
MARYGGLALSNLTGPIRSELTFTRTPFDTLFKTVQDY